MKNKYMWFFIVLLLLILISYLNKTRIKKAEYFFTEENAKCSFIPEGITIQECNDFCYLKKKEGNDQNCNEIQCSKICDGCTSSKCKWKNFSGNNFPDSAIISVYPGNRQCKILWSTPRSITPIIQFTIVLETEGEDTKLYYPRLSELELYEYTIFNLTNDKEYKVSLISLNDNDFSSVSDKVSFKTSELNTLPNSTLDDKTEKNEDNTKNTKDEDEDSVYENLLEKLNKLKESEADLYDFSSGKLDVKII